MSAFLERAAEGLRRVNYEQRPAAGMPIKQDEALLLARAVLAHLRKKVEGE